VVAVVVVVVAVRVIVVVRWGLAVATNRLKSVDEVLVGSPERQGQRRAAEARGLRGLQKVHTIGVSWCIHLRTVGVTFALAPALDERSGSFSSSANSSAIIGKAAALCLAFGRLGLRLLFGIVCWV